MPRTSETLSIPFPLEASVEVLRSPTPGPRPLLLLLHGMGQSPGELARRTRALQALDLHLAYGRGPYPLEVPPAGAPPGSPGTRIGYAWYTYDGDQARFARELVRGVAHVDRLLDALTGSLPVTPDRVALLGFSQGGYLGFGATVRLAHRLRGYVACSTRFKDELLGPELDRAPRRVPVLQLHGSQDPYLDPAAARASFRVLERHGWPCTWHGFDGTHQLGPRQLPVILDWLCRILELPCPSGDAVTSD